MTFSDIKQLEHVVQSQQREIHRLQKQLDKRGVALKEEHKRWEANSPAKETLEYVLSNLPLVLWSVNREGMFTQSQGAGLELLGLKSGEVYGQSIFDIYCDFPAILAAVRRALNGEEIAEHVAVGQVYFDCHYSPMWNAEGDVIGVRGVAMVVTDQVLAESAFRQSQELLAKAIQPGPLGLLIARGEDRRLVSVNEVFLLASGYSREEILGKPLAELGVELWPSDGENLQRLIEAGETISQRQAKYQAQDGQEHLARVSVETLRLEDTGSWVIVVEDVTGQTQARESLLHLNRHWEAQLLQTTHDVEAASRILQVQMRSRQEAVDQIKEEADQFQSLLTYLPDYVAVVIRDGTILFVNRTIPPLAVKDVVGSRVSDFLPEEERPRVRQLIERAFATGELSRHELTVHDPTGQPRLFDCRFGPFWRRGKVLMVMIIATDVTKQREVEDLAQSRQRELERLSRFATMGEMASIVAHYLNNPLAAILNYAHGGIRRLRTPELDQDQLADALSDIVHQCNRASDYIRQLRGFLQKRETRFDTVDLAEVLRDAVRLTDPEVRRQDLCVRLKIEEPTPKVFGDALQIEQVLVSLLLNAVDAMQPARQSALESAEPESPGAAPRSDPSQTPREIWVEVAGLPPGEVQVLVRDAGRGLTAGFEERIFEPFFTTEDKHLGMGLAVSRSIIESHGGRLEAEQNAGPGATFRFTLPKRSGRIGS